MNTNSQNTGLTNRVEEIFSKIIHDTKMMDEAGKKIDLYCARKFNFFNFFDFDENSLSDIIKELLDPKGTHGQGPVFLSHFLEECNILKGLGKTDLQQCQILREEMTDGGRRMDISIHGPGWAVCVEVKIDAPEQHNQLNDYFKDLKDKYHDKNKIFMVFLTKKGSKASSFSGQEIDMSYLAENGTEINPNVMDWLDRCVIACKSEKVRFFLKMFQEKIRELRG